MTYINKLTIIFLLILIYFPTKSTGNKEEVKPVQQVELKFPELSGEPDINLKKDFKEIKSLIIETDKLLEEIKKDKLLIEYYANY